MERLDSVGARQFSVCRRKVRVGGDGLLQQLDRIFVALTIFTTDIDLTA